VDHRRRCVCPRAIDRDGVLYDPPNLLGWRTVPFREMFREPVRRPVLVGNDANLACIGERSLARPAVSMM